MRVLWIVALCAALGGCASVMRGTTENISITSTPAGAEATISGLDVPTACITPCAIVAKHSADISITFAKPGFQTEVVTLTEEISATGAAGVKPALKPEQLGATFYRKADSKNEASRLAPIRSPESMAFSVARGVDARTPMLGG